MKKIVILLSLVIIILSINKEEKVIIPNDAIRFRIIANSNSYSDQNLKKEILKNLEKELENNNYTNINEAREKIIKTLPTYEKVIQNTLENNNYSDSFTINYGKNHFPEKEYKNVVYKEGDYESLVITLGDGKGDNFWCVLFPPLCLIDEENKSYPSLIKEIVSKYF